MAQTKRAFDEVRVPFAKMTFSPDVPTTALGANEYNDGLNVETDVRGIRSVAGDEILLPNVPGTPTFVSGNYRQPQGGKDNASPWLQPVHWAVTRRGLAHATLRDVQDDRGLGRGLIGTVIHTRACLLVAPAGAPPTGACARVGRAAGLR